VGESFYCPLCGAALRKTEPVTEAALVGHRPIAAPEADRIVFFHPQHFPMGSGEFRVVTRVTTIQEVQIRDQIRRLDASADASALAQGGRRPT
jgi:hypothetical protein